MSAASSGLSSRGSVDAAAAAESEDDAVARRSVVPPVAARSLWLAAAWTGAGAALLCAVVSIVVVAVCWLPASGASGNPSSTLRAGLLTFLASLHAGITLDEVPTNFVPLGMTMLVGLIAWRAGTGLADAVEAMGERAPKRLVQVGAVQALVFAAVCAVGAQFATLGTSEVSVPAVTLAALVLFAVTGVTGFVLVGPLRDLVSGRLPSWAGRVARAALLGITCYLAVGAVLVAGALVTHHAAVEALSRQVGGGWSGVPILVLGVLCAPNAVIAATSYLAGPGFALGTGTHVSLLTEAHGTLPAFPLLGAMPTGHGASWPVWVAAAATPLLAALAVARLVAGAPGWWSRLRDAGLAAAAAALLALVLAWQGGGAIGSGRLNAVGASPWRLGAAVAIEVAVVSAVALGIAAGATAFAGWRHARRGSEADFEAGSAAGAEEQSADEQSEDEQSEDEAAPGRLRSLLTSVGAAITPTSGSGQDEEQDGEQDGRQDDDPDDADPDAGADTDLNADADPVPVTAQLVDPEDDTRLLPHLHEEPAAPDELAG